MAKTVRKSTKRASGRSKSVEVMVPVERIERTILLIREEKVILDADLASLYGVTTSRLNEQVRRNEGRFPVDFMFQLTAEEFAALRSQFAISKAGRGGRRYPPYAFTEHGAIMAANVLNSERAVAASVMVVRTFVRLRQILSSHAELARKVREMEKQYNSQFREVFAAIRALMAPPEPPGGGRIGF
jgi:ORF6N domain-containing protein